MHADPRRILLVRLSHLGDVVQTLPVFHALRAAHPSARIAWVIQPEFADLVRSLEGLERVFLFERHGGARAWFDLARELEEYAADWAIDAQGNVKSALVMLLSRAARRSGLAREDWREPFAASVLTDPAPPFRGALGAGASTHSSITRVHAFERSIALAQHVAAAADEHARSSSSLSLTSAELAQGRARRDELFGAQATLAVLHVARRDDVRSWPSECFVELARELARENNVLVLSGPGEASVGAEIERATATQSRIRHWHGQRGLRELAAFFAACAERDGRLVACDSGPLHVACAVGLRVVALAGPQDAERTGPWPRAAGHVVVRSRRELACAPCLARSCSHPEGNVCLSTITVADVRNALAAVPSRAAADV